MVPRREARIVEAVPEPLDGPPGFGVRQSSGALEQASGSRKRQRTAALQDATAPKPAPGWLMAGEQVRMEQGAAQESDRGRSPAAASWREAAAATGDRSRSLPLRFKGARRDNSSGVSPGGEAWGEGEPGSV